VRDVDQQSQPVRARELGGERLLGVGRDRVADALERGEQWSKLGLSDARVFPIAQKLSAEGGEQPAPSAECTRESMTAESVTCTSKTPAIR